MPDRVKSRFSLEDPVQVNSRESCFRGWYASNTDSSFAPRLALIVENIEYPVLWNLARPDVADAFNNPNLINCGFVTRFESPKSDQCAKLVVHASRGDEVLDEVLCTRASSTSCQLAADLGTATYREWLAIKEPMFFWSDQELEDRISMFTYQPVISVILTVHNAEAYFLYWCIQSVRRQRYPHWELCIVYDRSCDDRTVKYLQSIAANDSRIRAISLKSSAGVATALNAGLANATGDFVLFLHHDDEVHPSALLEVVRRLNRAAHVDLIYSDEDRIDDVGALSQPTFKSDFDFDMFLAFNYVGGLTAMRRGIVLGLRGFRSECDGAQEWDLLLRVAETIGLSAIDHIQKPLYHRRMRARSALGFGLATKSTMVVSEHIERTGKKATAEPNLFYRSMRVRYLPARDTRAAIVLRAEDGIFQVSTIAESCGRLIARFYELIGCSLRPVTLALATRVIAREPDVSMAIIQGREGSYLRRGREFAPIISLSEMSEDVFVFVNWPLETVNHAFLDELVAQAMRDDCGLVTGLSLNSNGLTLHTGLLRKPGGDLMDPFAGIPFSQQGGYIGQLGAVRQVEGITDEFFAVKRAHLCAVGGLHAVTGSHMSRLVRRLAKNAKDQGLKILVTPYAVATFDQAPQRLPIESVCSNGSTGICINPNVMDFKDLDGALRKAHLQS